MMERKQIYTPEFKRWFGDWPLAARAAAIRAMAAEPITTDLKYTRSEAKDLYCKIEKAVNKADGKTVMFYHGIFGKMYKPDGLFVRVIPQLKTLFENSLFAYSETDDRAGTARPDGTIHKERRNVVNYDNYVAKAFLNGKVYYVRFTIMNETDGKRGIHSSMVTNVSLYDETANVASVPVTHGGRLDTDGIVDTKLQDFFERAKKSSKVVDFDGYPLVVYHGTTKDFTTFSQKTIGKANNGRYGFFFTPDESLATDFTRRRWQNTESQPKKNAHNIAVYLNLRNPLIVTAYQYVMNAVDNMDLSGYDGIIITPFSKEEKARWDSIWGANSGSKEFDHNQYVVFSPNQIKSATANNGQFNPESDNILQGIDEDVDLLLKKCHNSAFIKSDLTSRLAYNLPEANKHALNILINYFDTQDDVIVGANIEQKLDNAGRNYMRVGKIEWREAGYFYVAYKPYSDCPHFYGLQKRPKTFDAAVDVFFKLNNRYSRAECEIKPIYGAVFDYYKWKGQPDTPRFNVGDKVKYVGADNNWYDKKGSIWEIVKVITKKGMHLYDAKNEKAGTVLHFPESFFEPATPDDIAHAPILLNPTEQRLMEIEAANRQLPHKFKIGDKVEFTKQTFGSGNQRRVGEVVKIDYQTNKYVVYDYESTAKVYLDEQELEFSKIGKSPEKFKIGDVYYNDKYVYQIVETYYAKGKWYCSLFQIDDEGFWDDPTWEMPAAEEILEKCTFYGNESTQILPLELEDKKAFYKKVRPFKIRVQAILDKYHSKAEICRTYAKGSHIKGGIVRPCDEVWIQSSPYDRFPLVEDNYDSDKDLEIDLMSMIIDLQPDGDRDRRLRLAKAKAKALKMKLELMKI